MTFLKMVMPIFVLTAVFALLYFCTLPETAMPDKAEITSALNLLEDYGYKLTGNFNYLHLGACFGGFLLSCTVYLYLYYRNEQQKIRQVIDYVRKINQRVYDLKMDENSEDRLSLLQNELYKTAVLLQEAAEHDRLHARNLETALADISHQLKTPLTSLQITLDNLHEHPELDQETRQTFLRTASMQIKQMSRLITSLLNLARYDNGTLKMHPKSISASALLDDVAEKLSVLAELNGIKVEISGDLSAELLLDQKWQSEALANVVKNCIEHSKPGQTVHIEVQNNAIFTKIIISDHGSGIPRADLRHIFERFYKTQNSGEESVGIGLALAKSIIEAENGQIKVKSREGEGTTFTVSYLKSAA